MWARGFARRLCTHAGFVGAPPFDPMMMILSSMVRYASGESLGSPDLAPVVVSNSRVAPSKGSPTLPPLFRNSSTIFALNASISANSVTPESSTSSRDLFRLPPPRHDVQHHRTRDGDQHPEHDGQIDPRAGRRCSGQ